MWNGEIKTLNMNRGKIKLLASENDEAVECCQIEPTSLRAVTGGADGTVQGWNIINGKNKCFSYLFQNSSLGKSLFTGNTSNDIYCVATKNEKVASADCEGVIRLWTWTGQIIRVMKEHVGSIRTLHYHPYYEVLISGGDAKFLVLWDSESGTI